MQKQFTCNEKVDEESKLCDLPCLQVQDLITYCTYKADSRKNNVHYSVQDENSAANRVLFSTVQGSTLFIYSLKQVQLMLKLSIQQDTQRLSTHFNLY